MSFGGKHKSRAALKESISRWITGCIAMAYSVKGQVPPEGLRAHSTRGKASMVAFLRGVPIVDICRAARWATPHMFSDYCVDTDSRADASFVRAVLKSIL